MTLKNVESKIGKGVESFQFTSPVHAKQDHQPLLNILEAAHFNSVMEIQRPL